MAWGLRVGLQQTGGTPNIKALLEKTDDLYLCGGEAKVPTVLLARASFEWCRQDKVFSVWCMHTVAFVAEFLPGHVHCPKHYNHVSFITTQ